MTPYDPQTRSMALQLCTISRSLEMCIKFRLQLACRATYCLRSISMKDEHLQGSRDSTYLEGPRSSLGTVWTHTTQRSTPSQVTVLSTCMHHARAGLWMWHCGNVCDEIAPSRIYKFLCASGALPRLRRRLRRRPRALRAPARCARPPLFLSPQHGKIADFWLQPVSST